MRTWGDTSWKKDLWAYLAHTGRVVVHPYQSLSTNCSDAGGVHYPAGTSYHQVALPSPVRRIRDFDFCPPRHRTVQYDSQFEPCGDFVASSLGLDPRDLECDLYGTKRQFKSRYIISPNTHGDVLRVFGDGLSPHEMNVVYPDVGRVGRFSLQRLL